LDNLRFNFEGKIESKIEEMCCGMSMGARTACVSLSVSSLCLTRALITYLILAWHEPQTEDYLKANIFYSDY
jgi:hypothetical protein